MRIALCLVLALIAAPAIAASAEPAAGEKIAKAECASCHAIGNNAEARSPDPKAPRFIDVAKMPSATELSLKVFLRSSHRTMPNFILAREEIDSLASYILSLGGK